MILHMLVQTMRFLKLMPIFAASAMIMMAASCSSGKTDYESAILEWTGREIVFPDSMRLAGGGVFVKEPSDFTIVSYYGPKACSSCVLRLDKWQDLIEDINDYSPYNVEVVLISSPLKMKDVTETTRNTRFEHPLLLDEGERFTTANSMPEQPHLRTFLLDSKGKIVLLGNPLDLPALRKLYLKALSIDENEIDDETYLDGSYYFGRINPGEKVSHTFKMKNSSKDTLKVTGIETSCECTTGVIRPAIIPPHAEYEVEILFRDTVEGVFRRSATIYFDKQIPEMRFDISGEITNNSINPKLKKR